ncbi:hypothetical protein AHAS_Ahas14G0133900 [Arachis hypogaea]
MMGLVVCHERVHYNYCLGMHHRIVVGYSALKGVVAKRIDQILVASPIFDSSNLDACSHYSFHSLQKQPRNWVKNSPEITRGEF